jgi:hypothetical protein
MEVKSRKDGSKGWKLMKEGRNSREEAKKKGEEGREEGRKEREGKERKGTESLE